MVKTDFMTIDDLNNEMGWFVIHSITRHALKNGKTFFGDIKEWGKDLGKNIEITYSINGIELDFIECWKDYEKVWSREIRKKAKEMITKKTWDMFNGIREKANKLEKHVKEKIDELFPDLINEDDYEW